MDSRETKRIIIAGFGGQGVVLAGRLIAMACMAEDKNVTQMVSYGPEMRGGTANSTLVVAEKDCRITSPFFEHPDIAIIMNQQSLDKYYGNIRQGGTAVINSSLVAVTSARNDIDTVVIAATDIAHRLGNVRAANLVAIGAFIRATGIVKAESIESAVRELFSGKRTDLAELNKKALAEGIKNCSIETGSTI